MLKVSAKLHTIRSKIISLSGKSYPYYFIIAAILAAFYNVYFIILVIYLMYKFRRKFKIKLLLFFLILLSFSFLLNNATKMHKIKAEIKGTVVEVNEYNFVVKSGFSKYLIKTNEKYDIGDVLVINGDMQKPRGMRVPHGFNLKKYYLSKNIHYEINKPSIIKDGKNYLYYPNYLVNKYIDKFPSLTKTYLKSMILGVNEHEADFKKSANLLQISYLINLSGALVYAVINMLKKLFYYLDLSFESQDKIIIILLLIWNLLTGFKFVLFRILIMTIVTSLSNYLSLKLTRLDIIFYSFLLILLIKPNTIYSIGFSLSFIVLTTITLIYQDIKINNFLLKRYVMYIVINLSIFPILINSQNNIYFLVFLITPLLILLFQKGLVYIFILVFVFPLLSGFIEYYLDYFQYCIMYLSNIKMNLSFPSFNNIFMFLYYFILLFVFTNRKLINKNLISLLVLLIIVYNKAYFNPSYRLYFLDVNQGDTTIFITPNNEEVIVVDAYGDVLDVLIKMGIRKIDYLILTHPDNDHIKEASNLIENLEVKNILVNPYDDYKLGEYNLTKISSGDLIVSHKFKITFYSPNKNNLNTNDNSLVFKLEYLNNKVLFLGDISKKIEIELVNQFGKELESNILKLAHHGSNTSTSTTLINAVKPQDVIISVGLNNIYGFPHQEVLNTLGEKYKIYRTDYDYTIFYMSMLNYSKTTKYYQNYINYYIIIEKKKGRFYG